MPERTPSTSKDQKREIEALRAELCEVKRRLAEAQDSSRSIPSGEHEFTLKDTANAYRVLVEAMNEGAVMLDAHGIVLYCNQSLATLVQIPLEKIVGNSLSGIFASASSSTILELIARALAGEAPQCELELQIPNGRRVPVHVSLRQINDKEHTSLCMVVTDITSRKHVETTLLDSEERLRQLVDERTAQLQQANSELLMEVLERKRAEEAAQRLATIVESTDDAIVSKTLDGTIATWNRAAERLYGYTEAEVVGQSMMMVVPPRFRNELKEVVQRVGRGERVEPLEMVRVRKDGSLVDVQVTHSAIKDAWGKVIGVGTIVRDITERKQAEDKLHKLNRTLKATSNSDHALLHAETEEALLQRVCSIITEDCGYEMVWIGFAEDDDKKTVRPVAHAGFEKGYLETLRITWADTERGRGPTGLAVRTGQPCVCTNMLTDPRFRPWRDQAIKRGYASSVVLPLIEDGKAFGAVTIYSAEADAFLEDEVKLLVDLTADLAYGIRTLREHAARERAEEVLRESRAKLEAALASMTDAVFISDADGHFLEFNDAFANFYRYKNKSECASTFAQFPKFLDVWMENGEPAPLEMWAVPRALRGETATNAEYILRRKDTGETWVGSYSFAPIRDEGGAIVGCVVTGRDITERKSAEAALYRYELMASHTRDIVLFIRHEDGRILEANEAAAKAYGYTREELKSMTIHALRATSKRRQVLSEMAVAEMQGTLFESLHLRADGSTFPVEVSSQGATIGGVRTLISIVRDITERKQAEKARQDSETAFEALANLVPQFIWICSPDGLSIYFNQRWVDYTGLTLEESYGRGWNTPFHPDDKQAAWDAWNRATQTGQQYRIESRLRAADGSYRRFLMLGEPLRDSEGNVLRWFGTCTDIEDIRQAEVALRESETQFRTLANAIPQLSWMANADGWIFWYNDRWYEYTGTTPQQMEGWGWKSVHDPEALPKVLERWTGSIASGTPFDMVFPLRGADGVFRPFLTRVMPVRDGDGKITGWFGTNTDISDQRKTEEAMAQLNVTLEQSVRDRTAQLEASNKELESFAYSVSHDLRAPLRGIDGWSLALAEDYADSLDEKAHKYLDRVRSETQRMGLLIDDLLQLSRITRTELGQNTVDLTSIAQGIAARLCEAHTHRRIEFIIGPELTATGDARLLEIALTNLLDNAVKFTGPHALARIEVGQTECDGERPFYVRDNGVGFDMPFASKLFGAFQRLHKTSEFPGTGIGLATVQRIIHRHGGRIWAESKSGQGATFYFTIGAS